MAVIETDRADAMTVVARDVVIVDTPQLFPTWYRIRTTDREWQNIRLAVATSDRGGLFLALRP